MGFPYQRRLRDLREDHDKTQQDIADILGTSQTMYARYERGANELPLRHLLKLADYYGVSADYLLCRTAMPSAELSEGEYALIRAYRAADDRARNMVDLALEPFMASGEDRRAQNTAG